MARPRKSAAHSKIGRKVEKTDLTTARKLGKWRDHPVILGLGKVAELADQPPLYSICAAVAIAGLARRDGRLFRTGIRMLAAEWLATKAKGAIKHRVDRTRPHVPINGGRYRMEKGHDHAPELNSFPSGHTAGAVAVARAYASEYPEHWKTAALLAGFAGAIQIPRCAHFVSDVGAGALIGLTAGSLVARP